MLSYTIKQNIPDYDLWGAIQKAIQQSVLIVQWKAVRNAPYQTWTLRRSITQEVQPDRWVVWTNVVYAKVREFINKKNPSRRFYMKRAFETSINAINMYFNKAISDYLNK